MAEERENKFFDEAPVEFQEKEKDAEWYVIHTYSGHENKVKINIENMVKNRGYIDEIFKIEVPVEEVTKETGGVTERKIFPGYVFIKMIITDTTWYLVRNTRGVTSFVGPGSEPVPLTPEEILSFGVQEEERPVKIDMEIGDAFSIISGAFAGEEGIVEEIDQQKGTIKTTISIFGRETEVELDYQDIKKMN